MDSSSMNKHSYFKGFPQTAALVHLKNVTKIHTKLYSVLIQSTLLLMLANAHYH